MNRSLLKKTVLEARLLLLSCMAAVFSFCWAWVWLASQFEMGRFETVVEQFREYERFSPVPFEQLFTYTGRIAMAFDEPIVVLCISLWAIARGSDCISGEIGRGTMEMLLAQPVSRLQVLVSQASVTIVGIGILSLTCWLGIYAGIMTNTVEEPVVQSWTIPWLNWQLPNPLAEEQVRQVPMADQVDPAEFAPAVFNLFALGFFLAGISSLLSACDRYRWRTIGLVVGVFIFQLIVKVLGLASDRLDWLARCTFFTAYEPQRFVSLAIHSPESAWALVLRDENQRWVDLGPLGYDLVLIGLGAAAYLAAAVIFSKRDLPAPL